MEKEIIELEFKDSGKRYYFTTFHGIFTNFSKEEIGGNLRRIYSAKVNEMRVRETPKVYVRLLWMGGKNDQIPEVKQSLTAAEVYDMGQHIHYLAKLEEDPILYGSQILKRYADNPGKVKIKNVLFPSVSMPTVEELCRNGLHFSEVKRMLHLGWVVTPSVDGVYYFQYNL